MNASETLDFSLPPRLSWCLLLLRLGIGIVFVMWTVNKLINPENAAAVFTKYYQLQSLSSYLVYMVGTLQAIVVLAFVLGAFRTYSYSAILILHGFSTISSYKQYLDPWTSPHLLFFCCLSYAGCLYHPVAAA
ncbi:MAG: putative oxidoreductase [Desulforhopalus sp.]|jgi:putative oxidoreductase